MILATASPQAETNETKESPSNQRRSGQQVNSLFGFLTDELFEPNPLPKDGQNSVLSP